MFGNIKHKVTLTISADSPESRAIGIMKIATLLEDSGINLTSDLSNVTTQMLSEYGTTEKVCNVANATVLATIAESQPALPFSQMPYPWNNPYMPPGMAAPYPQPGRWGDAPGMQNGFGRLGAALSPLREAPGNIPGYEHNPMAQSEYFSGKSLYMRVSEVGNGERVLNNAWPMPLPLDMNVGSFTKSVGDPDADYGYQKYIIYARPTPEVPNAILARLEFNTAPSNQPANGVRVSDLLAICEDVLTTSRAAVHPEISSAIMSISKALKHLHSFNVEVHNAAKRNVATAVTEMAEAFGGEKNQATESSDKKTD
jgi:hypothetical protein